MISISNMTGRYRRHRVESFTLPNTSADIPNTPFQALILRPDDDQGYRCHYETLHDHDLPPPPGERPVWVSIDYSSLNYKDALAVTRRGPVVRKTPLVPGIDLAGRVLRSEHPGFEPGDPVLATGWGLGEKYWGGYAQRAQLPGDWLLPLPDGLSPYQAMALGTAGLTAMLCVLRLTDAGITPDQGAVAVSGASGGVAGIAISLLAARGFEVAAITGRTENTDYLRSLGAAEVVIRERGADAGRPLQKQRWAAAIDTVGDDTLAWILAQLQYGGSVAACGLAGGAQLQTTVMPFILRGTALLGVDSVYCPMDRRRRAWQALADELPASLVDDLCHSIPLDQVPEQANALLDGQLRGRLVVQLTMAKRPPL
jgi:acrylyl-CoA reductase (NADPH)